MTLPPYIAEDWAVYAASVPAARKRPTIRDVANATGLSVAAVSYALRGTHVSDETQERVRRVAGELGYEAHPIARALASGRTGMIGLLCGSLEDLWQQRLAAGIGHELLGRERYALIVGAGGDPERELTLARQLIDRRVEALVVSPLDPSAATWRQLAETVPIVSIGDSLKDAGTAGEVLFDNRAGVTMALEHLHDLGHSRVAVLTPTRPSTPDRPAELHVTVEAERLGLEVAIVSSSHDLAEAAVAAREILSRERRPTALFCFSDSIAYGAYTAAKELGLSIPDDLSVAGYDDQPVSRLLSPALTTFAWDIERIIAATVRLVMAAIDNRPQRRRIVQSPRLCQRESTARARRHVHGNPP